MFEKFLSGNAREFAQRYEGTYGFFRDEQGKKSLVRLDAVRDSTCFFSNRIGLEFHLNADTEKNIGFEFIPPKAQFYNTDIGALLVTRVAARQFQRGITHRNTSIRLLVKNGFGNYPVDFTNLEKIYLKATTPVDAFKNWGEHSVAISNNIAMSPKGDKVYLWDKVIGVYTKLDRHFMIKLEEPLLWRTEVTDAFKSLPCTFEVA